jgi:hypothetical protein
MIAAVTTTTAITEALAQAKVLSSEAPLAPFSALSSGAEPEAPSSEALPVLVWEPSLARPTRLAATAITATALTRALTFF